MQPHTTSTQGPNTQSTNRVLAVLGVGIALSLLGDQTLYTVLADPRVLSKAGISLAMVGVVLGVNRLTRIFFNIPSGFLYDRSKRRRLMVLSISIGALSTACYALAPNATLLLFGRVLWGIAWSGIWIGANTIALGPAAPKKSRSLSVVFTIGDLGRALGPVIGLALIPVFGIGEVYQPCALLYGAVALLAIWIAAWEKRVSQAPV
jgi:MFS family permease